MSVLILTDLMFMFHGSLCGDISYTFTFLKAPSQTQHNDFN